MMKLVTEKASISQANYVGFIKWLNTGFVKLENPSGKCLSSLVRQMCFIHQIIVRILKNYIVRLVYPRLQFAIMDTSHLQVNEEEYVFERVPNTKVELDSRVKWHVKSWYGYVDQKGFINGLGVYWEPDGGCQALPSDLTLADTTTERTTTNLITITTSTTTSQVASRNFTS